jgi:hypothetical protein
MANRLLRNIAVTIGAGLAVGLSRKAVRRLHAPAVNLSPILTRLDEIEHRVTCVEHAPPRVLAPTPEEIEALGTLVSSQHEDIEDLRRQICATERRNAEQVEVFGKKLAVVEQQLHLRIDAQVGGRMTELEQQLRGEFEQIHARTVDAFVQTIESRVIGRIGALENNLVTQAEAITALREKTTKTDESLMKLLSAVEKLCERAEARAQVPIVTPPAPAAEEAEPAQVQQSFAAHYQRAIAETEIALPDPEPKPEPQLQHAAYAGARTTSFRREMQSFGLSLIGLAILGLRLIR